MGTTKNGGASNVRAWLREAGLTQREAAERWEDGQHEPQSGEAA